MVMKSFLSHKILSVMECFASSVLDCLFKMHLFILLLPFFLAPSTPKPDARLPPSDLDSTFPHSSDSSLSFDG